MYTVWQLPEGCACGAQIVPVLLGAVPLKADIDEVAPLCSALAAMLLKPDLAPRLASFKGSLLQVASVLSCLACHLSHLQSDACVMCFVMYAAIHH